ncbi:MAG: VWA domain-containing protein, partial [Pseudomonadota bacterium]
MTSTDQHTLEAGPIKAIAAAEAQTKVEAAKKLWEGAQSAAILLAINPKGLGGVNIRSGAGPVRDLWTDQFISLLPAATPIRKIPTSAGEDRLLGGLDLSMTLNQGKPVAERGLFAEAHDGVIITAMAERMSVATAAHIASAMDTGAVNVERGGVSRCDPARFACLLYDESADASESPPAILLERVAFQIDLNAVSIHLAASFERSAASVKTARARLKDVSIPDQIFDAMNAASLSLGVVSMRALLFCVQAARACAAYEGRDVVSINDAQTATRLVFAPRISSPFDAPPESSASEKHQDAQSEAPENNVDLADIDNIEDMLVNAARTAAIGPALKTPAHSIRKKTFASSGGKSGALVESSLKGRPLTPRKGSPRDGGRLDVISTLRTAAPWRKLRNSDGATRLRVYPEDIHIKRFKGRAESVVIFVVDASGSSAMHRMAEAKGAVEYLLADCYTRRDYAALIAFRGMAAELLLPPTRSLLRVRRTLAHLPGGGGTPLAAGIHAAAATVELEKRKGRTPFVVFLSDGR